MINKYELTNETKVVDGHTLHRICALRSFGDVKAGDLGGWVEIGNLSFNGNSWVYDDSMVYGSWVGYEAKVCGNSVVRNRSYVHKRAVVNNSKVSYSNILYNLDNQNVEGFNAYGYKVNYSDVDKNGDHFIRVGCQVRSIRTWKNPSSRTRIMRNNNFQRSYETEFLNILSQLESKHCPKKDPFIRIDGNISEMKKTVTEALKTETVSLISSLQVPVPVVSKGPQRDKFGRFLKKT